MNKQEKSFGLWSAVFLGIGSMVGAGIFVLLGEAGEIAGNLVFYSFIIGGIVALLSGYSLAKLSVAYPSRGGIIEYLVQCYGEGMFSGTIAILFYLSGLVAISMVAKTFGTYATMLFGLDPGISTNIFSIGILLLFLLINLIGSKMIAKSENIIVIFKLVVIVIFAIVISFFINPELLSFSVSSHITNVLGAVGLTFFAYEGFRVITNTVEDMKDPSSLMLKSMFVSILLVMLLYIFISFVVFGNLSIDEIINAQDYALAEAAKPVFGQIGFIVMSIAALVSTSSSINANLYSIANTSYDMAKNGELPKVFQRGVYDSNEGLIISVILIGIMIVFFDLSLIASVGAVSMLFIHLIIHIGHFRLIKTTKASKFLIISAILAIIGTIILASNYSIDHIKGFWEILLGLIVVSFLIEFSLKKISGRVIKKHT